MYKVILTKLESVHNNLRTDKVEGTTFKLPLLGESFTLLSESLNKESDHVRTVETSIVEELKVLNDGSILFKTKNSSYELKITEWPKCEDL